MLLVTSLWSAGIGLFDSPIPAVYISCTDPCRGLRQPKTSSVRPLSMSFLWRVVSCRCRARGPSLDAALGMILAAVFLV